MARRGKAAGERVFQPELYSIQLQAVFRLHLGKAGRSSHPAPNPPCRSRLSQVSRPGSSCARGKILPTANPPVVSAYHPVSPGITGQIGPILSLAQFGTLFASKA